MTKITMRKGDILFTPADIETVRELIKVGRNFKVPALGQYIRLKPIEISMIEESDSGKR